MEIEQLRQEINDLLENVIEHSNSYTSKEHLSSLDVGFILKKVNKVQESLTVLKYLSDVKHDERGYDRSVMPSVSLEEVVTEELITEVEAVPEESHSIIVKEELSAENIEVSVTPEVQEEEIIAEAENVKQPTVAKLSDGLTLNDRYLFANELCSKDMNAFNELVKSIDSCSSLDEATKLYSTMDWEIDNEHVVTFTDLVERRFS